MMYFAKMLMLSRNNNESNYNYFTKITSSIIHYFTFYIAELKESLVWSISFHMYKLNVTWYLEYN